MGNDHEGLIILENFTFPNHWKVQAWLNNTEYGEQFTLVMVDVKGKAIHGRYKCVSALEPTTDQAKFYWTLRGPTAAKELEEKILDFTSNLKYNM